MILCFALVFCLGVGVLSRQSGGGLGARHLPSWLTWLPEVLLITPLGILLYLSTYPLIGHYAIIAGVLSFVWSYLWMQSATAPGLHWGNGGYNPSRSSRLKPVVDFINKYTLRADPSGETYCWLYMSVKGFLIGLPIGGIPLAIFWPLGYWLADVLHDLKVVSLDKAHALMEFFAGFGYGLCLLAFAALVL